VHHVYGTIGMDLNMTRSEAMNVVAYCMVCKRMLLFTTESMHKTPGLIENLGQSTVTFVPIYCSSCGMRIATGSSTNGYGEVEETIVYRKELISTDRVTERDGYRVLDKVCNRLEFTDENMVRVIDTPTLMNMIPKKSVVVTSLKTDIWNMSVCTKPYVELGMITDGK
jgi:hypothetical protein